MYERSHHLTKIPESDPANLIRTSTVGARRWVHGAPAGWVAVAGIGLAGAMLQRLSQSRSRQWCFWLWICFPSSKEFGGGGGEVTYILVQRGTQEVVVVVGGGATQGIFRLGTAVQMS